jgi:hypothetical protein
VSNVKPATGLHRAIGASRKITALAQHPFKRHGHRAWRCPEHENFLHAGSPQSGCMLNDKARPGSTPSYSTELRDKLVELATLLRYLDLLPKPGV